MIGNGEDFVFRLWKPTVLLLALCVMLSPTAGLAKAGFTSYRKGDPGINKIAITVDDLYGLDHLESMLDLAREYEIPITFFALGMMIKPENAALWQRMVDEGHEIGNHTYSHLLITEISSDQLGRQLRRTQDALNAVLREPYPMHLFRPPFGAFDHSGFGSVAHLGAQGYPYVILWSVDLVTVEHTFEAVKNGSILLFHTNSKDVQVLKELIPKILEAGFEPVTVTELLQLPPVAEGTPGD